MALLLQGFEDITFNDRESIFNYSEKYSYKDTEEGVWLWG